VPSCSVGWLMRAALALVAVRVAAQGVPSALNALPDGPNKRLVQQSCTRCHSSEKFTAERHTRDDWAEEVDVMVRYGTRLNKEEAAQVTDYLAAVFPGKPKPPGVVVPGPVRAVIKEWPVATPAHGRTIQRLRRMEPFGTPGRRMARWGGSIPQRAKQRNSPSRNCHRPRPSYHMVWGRTD
jgi:hypothetical protein